MKLPAGHVAGIGVAKPKCTGGFGERMLRSMGWDAGQGLGAQGTGIKEAIQVKKKEDTVGVGGNGSYAWGNKWWEKAFDSALQTVDDSGSSDSSDSDSDDEHAAQIAAAVNRDGTATSASADELRLLASLSKGGRVAAGRFGGRDAKMARIRQQEAAMAAAAAARLGGASGAAAGGSDRSDTTSEVQLSGGSGKNRGAAAEGAAEAASSGKKARKAKDRGAEAAAAAAAGGGQQGEASHSPKKQRIVIEPAYTALGPAHTFVPTPAAGWWGAKVFASAGCLEGIDAAAAEAQRRRTTFDEDDQARIYNAAQAKKTQGKVGLGQGSGTVKVGGVKWAGKKVSFEETEEGGEAEAEGAAAAGGCGLAATGSCTHLAALAGGKQRKRAAAAAAAAAAAGEEAQEGADGWQAAVKWRKIIVQQLAAADQRRMKVKELQRLVVTAVLAKHGGIVSSKAAVKAAFCSRLEGSSKWVVEGKLVRLSS